MPQNADARTMPAPRPSLPGGRHIRWMLALAALCAALALGAPYRLAALGFTTAAVSLLVLAAGLLVLRLRRLRQGRQDLAVLADFMARDAVPGLICSADGLIRRANPAAEQAFDTAAHRTLAGLLNGSFAHPSGVLFRLQTRAAAGGSAQEDVYARKGHMRLSVHRIAEDSFAWRIEEIGLARGASESHQLPMVMVGRGSAVLSMNMAARTLVGARVNGLDRLFTKLPVRAGQVVDLSTESGPQPVLIAEVRLSAGRRALYLLPPPEDAPRPSAPGWRAAQDLPVPLLRLDAEGRVRGWSPMAATLIGARLEEKAHLSQLMEGLGRPISDWITETLEGRVVQKSEFLRLSRPDREVFVQVVLSRVQESGGPGLIAVLHDATELKTLEAQFVQSQKMQAIGQLAGGVAHDFNNLLTAISGHCDLLLLRHDQSDPDFADLMQISQNTNRAAALVGQLLAFSRKQTLRPEPIDMRDTLADMTHLLNRLMGERITLRLSHAPDLKPVRADKRQLEQVLMNLAVNARDAMPEGGEIRISTQMAELSAPMTRDRATVPAGAYVTIKISDDGIGIPQGQLQKVFEPFYTTKRTGEGTGLGLSTAYGIVKQSNGFIFVDSEVGRGTTFTLYLPVQDSRPAKEPQPAKPPEIKAAPAHDGVILLVEDEAPVRAFASRALRLRGYTVLEADSAEAALATLEDGSLSVDVFVTDVVMPGRDGPSWVKEALQRRPDVRVVFVSGYAEDSFGEEQTRIPNSVFLPKPFSLTELTETVGRQLH